MTMLAELCRGPDSWLREHCQPEALENANSEVKNDNPNPLRKRRKGRQCNEERLRGLCSNLKRPCDLHRMVQLSVKPVMLTAGQSHRHADGRNLSPGTRDRIYRSRSSTRRYEPWEAEQSTPEDHGPARYARTDVKEVIHELRQTIVCTSV